MKVIIIGGGGHSTVLYEALSHASDIQVVGYTDLHKKDQMKCPYLGNDDIIEDYHVGDICVANGMGSSARPHLRQLVFDKFKGLGYSFVSVIHPSAVIAEDVHLGEGVQVLAGSVINTAAIISDNVIINTRTSIDHHCRVGAHSHIAPGVTLSGRVSVGSGCLIGVGSTVIQGMTIGDSALVGAGSVVVKDVGPQKMAMGVPARCL